MNSWSRFFRTILLLVAQVLIYNYFNLTQFVLLTFLPGIILFLPIETSTIKALVIAFVMGFAVDFFASGVIGLTIASLLPVALLRRPIITLVFGEELFSRGEDINLRRQGLFKANLGIVLGTAVFLLFYITVDGAGMRPFWFNLVRFVASLAASSLVSLFIAGLLTEEDKGRWR